MNRGKRQSAHHKTDNTLVLGPRRRRRDVAPHEGAANEEPAADQPFDEEDDLYEAPAIPSKPQVAAAKVDEVTNTKEQGKVQLLSNEQLVNKNPALNNANEKDKSIDKSLPLQSGLTSAAAALQSGVQQPQQQQQQQSHEINSNENSDNPVCNNFVLPLAKTTIDGINYYNMSVSILLNINKFIEKIKNCNNFMDYLQ